MKTENIKNDIYDKHDKNRSAHHHPHAQHYGRKHYKLSMAPERTSSSAVIRSTANRRPRQPAHPQSRWVARDAAGDDALEQEHNSEEDTDEDTQLNVFLAGCNGLSRNRLEKEIKQILKTPVRIHPMRSKDHRRARLHTAERVQKLLDLELLEVRGHEVRAIEWDPIVFDMEPREAHRSQ